VTPNLQVVDNDNVASVVIANSSPNKNAELWLGEGANGLGQYRMGWEYDGDANELHLLSHVYDSVVDEGVQLGPWMTVRRDTGMTGVAEENPRKTLSVGPYLDIYSGYYDDGMGVAAENSIRASVGNLIINAKGTTGDVYINSDTGDDLLVRGNVNINNNGNSDPNQSMLVLENYDVGPDQFDSMYIWCIDRDTNQNKFYVTKTGRAVANAVQINGGGDIVEGFNSPEGALEPGTVVSIDPENPGQLKTSSVAYDAKVAGVVSGAGGVNHGLQLGQDGVLDGENLIALTGRVYVKCTDENGPIQAGDLLTTAGTRGHAMRADDPLRSFGSVIGKAMTTLDSETGLVLVLVNLQ